MIANPDPAMPRCRVTKDQAWSFANQWIAAWNAHDLDAIIAHYDEDAELISPVAKQLIGAVDGRVKGKANLRAYFQQGLEVHPNIEFHIKDVLWGMGSVVLYYSNWRGTYTAEFMEVSAGDGKIVRVVANYNG
jgi:ketosteroid isomerase-like protein